MVNADESEPGACKDIPLMLSNPHAIVEGCVLAAHAIRASHAFIYIRGEVPHVVRRVRKAVQEAYAAGFVGQDVLGTGIGVEIVVHAGAGAYICGEETALLDSLEGRRGQPRLKPPFPAVAGLYASPTVVNNAETIANVPYIARNGADWLKSMGTEKSPGFKLFSVSGHVKRPGVYEAALGTTMAELLEYAGGVREGHELKFWVPGGSSVPMLLPESLELPMTYEDMQGAGDDAGHRHRHGVRRHHVGGQGHQPLDLVLQARVLRQVHPLSRGHLLDRAAAATVSSVARARRPTSRRSTRSASRSRAARSAPLGDAAATPYAPALKYFRSEFEAGISTPADELFDPIAATVFSTAGAL